MCRRFGLTRDKRVTLYTLGVLSIEYSIRISVWGHTPRARPNLHPNVVQGDPWFTAAAAGSLVQYFCAVSQQVILRHCSLIVKPGRPERGWVLTHPPEPSETLSPKQLTRVPRGWCGYTSQVNRLRSTQTAYTSRGLRDSKKRNINSHKRFVCAVKDTSGQCGLFMLFCALNSTTFLLFSARRIRTFRYASKFTVVFNRYTS